MAENMLTKGELRKEALRRRNSLSAEQRARASLAICGSIMEDDQFLDARGVHVYIPFGTEVDINPIIQLSWEMGKEVGLMRVREDGGSAQLLITPATEYVRGRFGILEPVEEELFDMNICDLVIVPLLAADEECNRIGYGKGHYDQFLSFNPRPAIGVAFEEQIFPELPVDDLDVRLDTIYTEDRVITGP
jgi:5-formyltetrahydrofolate cyclo-ligase